VNCQARTIVRNSVPLELRGKDFDLSVLLLQNVGRYSPAKRSEVVWGAKFNVHSRTMDTHVSHVRNRLLTPEHGWRLTAVYGHGYRLEQCKSEPLSPA